MHIYVCEGNRCWLVSLVDPDKPSWIFQHFATKDEALEYAYKLTSLKVCVERPTSDFRRLSDVK